MVEFLMPALAFGTLLAVAVFAYVSQQKTLARLHDKNSRKSTLASDKDSHGRPADV